MLNVINPWNKYFLDYSQAINIGIYKQILEISIAEQNNPINQAEQQSLNLSWTTKVLKSISFHQKCI